MARKPYVGGNWKMNLNLADSIALAGSLAARFESPDAVDVAVFPAMPYMLPVAATLKAADTFKDFISLGEKTGPSIKVGAQDFYVEPNGAFTGEVSLEMLKDIGVSVVLVGHSERRHVIGEDDILINKKVLAALEGGFEVILAIGEKLEQREAGQTDAINAAQLSYGLAGVTAEQMANIVVAYEPVWAIGTGKTATPEDAEKAHLAIREHLAAMYGADVAGTVRIQYGGSMKPGNASDLLAQPNIDGGLIGGASLKTDDFMGILDAAK